MRTYVVFVTDKDLDIDMSVQDPLYYKTLNGMVRNYYGNTNAVANFVRSYGYSVISPRHIAKSSISSIVSELRGKLTGAFDNYQIPVIVDCAPDQLDLVCTELDRMEAEIKAVNPEWQFNRLAPTSTFHLEPL